MELVFALPIIAFFTVCGLDSYFESRVQIQKELTKQRTLELCIKLGCTEEQLRNTLTTAFEYDDDDKQIQEKVEK